VMFAGYSFDTTMASGTLVASFPVTPLQYGSVTSWGTTTTHLGYAASFFQLWRGSMHYQFFFPSTQYRKARIAITWSPYALLGYSENVHQQIVTINGSTSVDFSVPWNMPEYSRPLLVPLANTSDGGSNNGYIQIWILAKLTTASDTSTRQNKVYVRSAAGADLQFMSFKPLIDSNRRVAIAATPGLLKATRAQGPISAATGSTYTGIIAEDNVLNLREIVHRYTSVQQQVPFTTGTTLILNPMDYTTDDLLAYVYRKFVYWRGSVNYKVLTEAFSPYPCQLRMSREGNIESGAAYVDTRINPCLEVTVPFISRYGVFISPNASPDQSSALNYVLECAGDTTVDIHRSGGDDFNAGYLLPSPIFHDV